MRPLMPFRIDDVSPAGGWRVALSTQFCAYADSRAAALLDDLADGGTGIVQTASVLADELFHAFGIAEAAPITRDVHVPPWCLCSGDQLGTGALDRGEAHLDPVELRRAVY